MTNVVQLDDRRLPHSQRAQRLKIMKRPVPLDLDGTKYGPLPLKALFA